MRHHERTQSLGAAVGRDTEVFTARREILKLTGAACLESVRPDSESPRRQTQPSQKSAASPRWSGKLEDLHDVQLDGFGGGAPDVENSTSAAMSHTQTATHSMTNESNLSLQRVRAEPFEAIVECTENSRTRSFASVPKKDAPTINSLGGFSARDFCPETSESVKMEDQIRWLYSPTGRSSTLDTLSSKESGAKSPKRHAYGSVNSLASSDGLTVGEAVHFRRTETLQQSRERKVQEAARENKKSDTIESFLSSWPSSRPESALRSPSPEDPELPGDEGKRRPRHKALTMMSLDGIEEEMSEEFRSCAPLKNKEREQYLQIKMASLSPKALARPALQELSSFEQPAAESALPAGVPCGH